MSELVLFPDFREQYAPTPYPFMDGATLVSTTGQILDRDLFIDASVYPIGATGYVAISNINVAPRQIRITLADQTRNPVAFAAFDPLTTGDTLAILDNLNRPAGILVTTAEKLASFTAWPAGDHPFLPTAAQFVPSCVIPTPEIGVRGVLTDKNELFTGDLIIIGENGVVVRQDGVATIRIDVVGDPLFRRKLCSPLELFRAPTFIKTINGCTPDVYGNFNITVGSHRNSATVVRILKQENGLAFEAAGS